jgi:hypothetical protein
MLLINFSMRASAIILNKTVMDSVACQREADEQSNNCEGDEDAKARPT